jgi:predicted dehydrogenase
MDETTKDLKPAEPSWSRRKFLGAASTAAAGLMVVPRHVVGSTQKKGGRKAPSDTLNIACVAVGGMGASDTRGCRTENIVALCDVDDESMARLLRNEELEPAEKAMYEKAAKYRDWRRMFEKEKGIDAVTVSTPDHNHAVIAMAAIKLGKHVYVQKPLTHTIKEARLLAQAAKEANVVTQMGNQGHAGEGARLVCEWIWAGAIGNVTEVHCWTNRPIWPQGDIPAPAEIPSVPGTLDWDVWLGPAPYRPYHPAYHPFKWRGLWDFGTGALGDMGAHIMDQPFWALKLKSPVSVQASSTVFSKDYAPAAEVVTYEFAAREGMPPVTMTWWDGGLMPPRPPELEQGRMVGDDGGGVFFRGDKGLLMCGTYGENPRLVPESRMQDFQRPDKTIPRSPGIRLEWFEAIKKGAKSTTDFAYSGALTETMLLANVAVRLKDKNMKLLWNGDKMEFTNLPEANELLHFPYRPGWSL